MRLAVLVASALLLAPTADAASRPGEYLADARGRIHLGTSHLAEVRGWKDERDCKSTFEFYAPDKTTVRWTLNWAKVRNVQISTRRHFMTDVEEEMYHQQPGLILYGRETTSGTLPDGTVVKFDNLEFFLNDVSKMDYAFKTLKDYAAECRRKSPF